MQINCGMWDVWYMGPSGVHTCCMGVICVCVGVVTCRWSTYSVVWVWVGEECV